MTKSEYRKVTEDLVAQLFSIDREKLFGQTVELKFSKDRAVEVWVETRGDGFTFDQLMKLREILGVEFDVKSDHDLDEPVATGAYTIEEGADYLVFTYKLPDGIEFEEDPPPPLPALLSLGPPRPPIVHVEFHHDSLMAVMVVEDKLYTGPELTGTDLLKDVYANPEKYKTKE